ncbi:MAG: hypothetical protein HOV81_13125 [Kofleriaceae bacterium]|nr:hypothetical protein [Kofleriaceae bacterium]
MHRLLVAALLLAACRGDRAPAPTATKVLKDAGLDGPASRVSDVPALPRSDDGVAELHALDQRIEIAAEDTARLVGLLLERAAIRGHALDYERALAASAALVKELPRDVTALELRVKVLTAVHRFADARAAIAELAPLVFPVQLVELNVALDEATGQSARALEGRAKLAAEAPTPQMITLYAGALARAGKFDEALAQLPKAIAGAARINTPRGTNWLYFQWGLIYEAKGDLAIARDHYLAAYARMPGSLETVEHLAGALAATGDRERARRIVADAVADNPHPSLRALALELADKVEPSELALVTAEWESYVKALPEAFADHAARFYLGVGKNPTRALELARLNLANRDTLQARALVVDAALAAGDPAGACAVVEPLLAGGTKAERFSAWKALGACGRKGDAEKLARELGI